MRPSGFKQALSPITTREQRNSCCKVILTPRIPHILHCQPTYHGLLWFYINALTPNIAREKLRSFFVVFGKLTLIPTASRSGASPSPRAVGIKMSSPVLSSPSSLIPPLSLINACYAACKWLVALRSTTSLFTNLIVLQDAIIVTNFAVIAS